mmetsp:Transcript_9183/g.13346  ORF Transcript_9183/g.13346 Transcript_9183/m.13346 type:complete len:650 (+) Transcript_9183:48-1997(+)
MMSSSPDDGNNLSDEEMRKLLKPAPIDDQILVSLNESYGPGISIVKELDSYDDVNYLIEMDGIKYLAKVHNGVESDDYLKSRSGGKEDKIGDSVIDLKNLIFRQLSDSECGTTSSYPIPVKNTSNISSHSISVEVGDDVSVHSLPVISAEHSPRPLVVQVLKWVEGSPMSSASAIAIETIAEAGAYLGRMCRTLDSTPPNNASKRFHLWDGKNTTGLLKFVSYIKDDKRRALVESIIAAFKEDILPKADEFRTGLLQGDFNDANIIMDGQGHVNGVIDFGDSVYSWRVLDITVAMAYAMLSSYGKTKHSLAASAAMLRGFHKEYPLTMFERKHLRLLVSCRLACSVTLGAFSYEQNPGNEYLLLHARPAWDALDLIWGGGCDADSIDLLFDIACDNRVDDVNGNEGATSTIDCSNISSPDPDVYDAFSEARVKAFPSQKGKKRKKGGTDEKPVITFVTGNKKKLEEVKQILSAGGADLPFEIVNRKIDLPELQGEPNEIAKGKCMLAAKEVGGAVITEDTSLCFNALNGMPGPYIKWFLDKCGHDGLNGMLSGFQDKSGYAQTVVAFCSKPGADVMLFDGRTNGKIVPSRGCLDFGWDPIFEPDESDGLTYAEMAKDAKNAISHRGRSFRKVREYLLGEEATIKMHMMK